MIMTAIDHFSPHTIQRFQEALTLFVREELRMKPSATEKTIEVIAQQVTDYGKIGMNNVFNMLEGNEIQLRWNHTFKELRSKFIAEWIKPYIIGDLLDLLCGDGDISRHLSELNFEVSLSECRSNEYEKLRFISYDRLLAFDEPYEFDTVLLSNVLHHSYKPGELLALGAKIAKKRLIIIENCLEERYSSEFHLLMDLFFNFGLNQLNEECPGSHKYEHIWHNDFSKYGDIILLDRKENIPGVFLPHSLFVIDIN
jgi:2-polyprenyl-3-methyl-5-hydroxy-6-metoxy-1,4-benzoquinol methylase